MNIPRVRTEVFSRFKFAAHSIFTVVLAMCFIAGTNLSAAPKDGDLVQGNSGGVYLIRHGERCLIENAEAFKGMGFQWKNVIKIPNDELLTIPKGPMIRPPKILETIQLGPPIYLAAVHHLGGKAILQWKYNVSRPDFVKVKVVNSKGQEVALVRRPVRRVDLTGQTGPFHLIPLQADGRSGEEISAQNLPLPVVPFISQIGIRQRGGRAEFVELATGKVFHPMGMNYVPLRYGDHAAFEAATTAGAGFYHPLDAETMLSLLREDGYNTVRVFLLPGPRGTNVGHHWLRSAIHFIFHFGRVRENRGLSGDKDTQGVYTPYLDNLADFLKRASDNGIHVIFNFGDVELPRNSYFRKQPKGEGNTGILFSSAGVLAYREMVASTLAYLKAKNPNLLKVILGVECNNEVNAKMACWPFNVNGLVTTANGKTYDMRVPEERARCYKEGLEFFYQQVCATIKAIDPDLLTCESVFVAHAVGRDYRRGNVIFEPDEVAKGFEWDKRSGWRVPPSLALLARTPLDFVCVHLYPTGKLTGFDEEIGNDLESSQYNKALALGLCSKKPLLMDEFGAFKPNVANDTGDGLVGGMRRWTKVRRLACEKYGCVGYLGWAFDTFEQTNIFQAMAFGPRFLSKFRAEFAWPTLGHNGPPDPKAAARNPLVLRNVAPTGRGHGFLVPISKLHFEAKGQIHGLLWSVACADNH